MRFPRSSASSRLRAGALVTAAAAALAIPAVGAVSAEAATDVAVGDARGGPPGVRLTLPAPTGRFSVGARSTFVTDPSRIEADGRPRTLPVRVWYPARSSRGGSPTPYLPPLTQAYVEQTPGVPPGLFDIDTHATTDAPARAQIRGVVLVQPGGDSITAFQTGLVTELASQGYAVVAVEVP